MPNSLKNIPEVWIARISCPVCGTPGLEILRFDGMADQIFCHHCHIKLEVEDGGNNLMIAQPPDGISSKVIGRWFSFPELIEIGRRLKEKKVEQKTGAAVSEPLSPTIQPVQFSQPAGEHTAEEDSAPRHMERDSARINELYSLGNSIDQIRSLISSSSTYSPEEINEMMAGIEQVDRVKKKRRNRLIILLVVLIALIAICSVLIFSWRQYL